MNNYQPQKAKIIKIDAMSSDFKRFRLGLEKKFPVKKGLAFVPGQFVLAGVWGYGEAPFGAASSPIERRFLEIGVRKVGTVTGALHRSSEGDEITIRGPYGNGYPIDFFEGKDIVMVTGGCGIPPIAALCDYISAVRKKFDNVYLLYGAKTPNDLLFEDRYPQWEKNGINVLLSVDQPTPDWKGGVGLVSGLVKDIKINPNEAVVAMCGPGPMTRALEGIFRPMGVTDRRIFVSEERKMSCGIGKCQHCTCGDKYVCTDGPVFNYDEVQGDWD
jgi:sulfhydrogenase subunit gamma (sulfur reductase)